MVAMGKEILIVITLFVVSFFVECEHQNHYDYFIFELVWPNTYCNRMSVQCKEPIPQEFKVHGLRSYMSNHKIAQSSPSFSFHLGEVKKWNFSSTLALVWPKLDYSQQSEERFWQRQWSLNGRGASANMSPENYFYLGVQYAKRYENIYHDLLQSGIMIPSDQLYRRDVIYDEFTKIVGSSPMMRCDRYKSQYQLLNVCICIDNKGVAFDCPVRFQKCGYSNRPILFLKEGPVHSHSRKLQDTVRSSILKRSISTINQSRGADFGPNVTKNTYSYPQP